MIIKDKNIFYIPAFSETCDRLAVLNGKDYYGSFHQIILPDIHTIAIGSPGSGKTWQIMNIMLQTTSESNNIHIIFDPKADYIKKFYNPNTDSVLSLHDIKGKNCVKWNIMREILADSYPHQAIREISHTLFKPFIDKSSNPVFPTAAMGIFSSMLELIYRKYPHNPPYTSQAINLIRSIRDDDIRKELSKPEYKDLFAAANLLNPNAKVTAGGVRTELEAILNTVFDQYGNYCSNGDFSVRNFIQKAHNGSKLFIIYEFGNKESSKDIIRLLLDLMMKEALSLSVNHRRIYFYLDEFPVLMNDLSYISDIVQFGRSLNVRVIAGIQNIPQLYVAYGKDKGNALLSGFVTTLIMNPNDTETLHILSERSGKELVHIQSMGPARNSYHTETMYMNIISEDEISMLDTGETIVSIKEKRPFWIKLD